MVNKNIEEYSDAEACPVRNVIDRFGDKWSMLVLLILNDCEVLRFNEIHKYINSISQKMLSVTLKSLESDGLVSRKVYPQVPPKVEYALTDMGRTLIPHLGALVTWANKNHEVIKASRKKFSKR